MGYKQRVLSLQEITFTCFMLDKKVVLNHKPPKQLAHAVKRKRNFKRINWRQPCSISFSFN